MLNPRVARLWCLLCLAVPLAACSSGGGGSDTPVIPWGRFRSGVANTAFASGGLNQNRGEISVLIRLGTDIPHTDVDGLPVTVGGLTASTPIIGTNEKIYIGTTEGILVMKRDGTEIRVFNQCTLPGTPPPAPIPVGPVSGTAAINLNNDVIFGSDGGQVFAFHDDERAFQCLWVYPPENGAIANGVVSSPLILSDAFDLTQVSTYIGLGSGHFQALNTFGTEQWRFPTGGAAFPAPLTSSAATDGVSFHVSAPDGFLYSLDRSGRLRHQARISMPITDSTTLLASPISGSSIYGIGLGGRCGDSIVGCVEEFECSDTGCVDFGDVGVITALDSLDEVRWRFAADAPIAGSGTFVVQSIDEPVPPEATPTPSTTAPVPEAGTPTPSPTRRAVILQGVVYVVDSNGTIYGVKDASGELFEARTTLTPTPTFIPGTNTPTPLADPPADPEGKLAKEQIEGPAGPVQVTASPALSSDLFVVFGTTDGEIYAVRLDYDRTSPCDECEDSVWDVAPFVGGGSGGGKAGLPVRAPIASSPIIDRDGSIYVTAGDLSTSAGTLYRIGSHAESE